MKRNQREENLADTMLVDKREMELKRNCTEKRHDTRVATAIYCREEKLECFNYSLIVVNLRFHADLAWRENCFVILFQQHV